jgi:hypothetical protein
MIAWMFTIGISVAALIVTAAARPGNLMMAYNHLAIAACVATFFTLDGIRKTYALGKSGAGRNAVLADGLRASSMVWGWAAIVLIITYGTGVLAWKDWLPHAIAMLMGAGACMAIAAPMEDSADDERLLAIARTVLAAQLVGMLVLIAIYLFDGEMSRFLIEGATDWPARNVIFFGAVAIAALSGATLQMLPGRTGAHSPA